MHTAAPRTNRINSVRLTVPLVSGVAVALLASLLLSVNVAAEEAPGAKVIVTINDQQITEKDLARELERPDLKATLESIKDDSKTTQRFKNAVVSSIIDRELLLSAARKSQVVKSEEIKKELDTLIEQQGGRNQIEPVLKTYGTTWDTFIKGMNERVTIEKYIAADLLQNVTITDDSLKKEFAEHPERYAIPELVQARHILVRLQPTATQAEQDAALKKAQAIYSRVTAAGADFTKIAQETSEDETTKTKGGDLGRFQKGMMVPEFEQASFSLKKGEISKPIKTAFGYHIIKVEEHTQSEAPAFDAVKDRVRYSVMAQAHDKIVTAKLSELRSSAATNYVAAEYKPQEQLITK
jgi:parvulin-like peptidyl-prolyl isomerase